MCPVTVNRAFSTGAGRAVGLGAGRIGWVAAIVLSVSRIVPPPLVAQRPTRARPPVPAVAALSVAFDLFRREDGLDGELGLVHQRLDPRAHVLVHRVELLPLAGEDVVELAPLLVGQVEVVVPEVAVQRQRSAV